MTMTVEVQALFDDATTMHNSAMSQMIGGDIRDAAEKAWCATLQATNAVILAQSGVLPEKTPVTSQELNKLRAASTSFESLVRRYYTRQGLLHGECFYLGLCEPQGEIERRIRETGDYIADARELANSAI